MKSSGESVDIALHGLDEYARLDAVQLREVVAEHDLVAADQVDSALDHLNEYRKSGCC